MRDRNYTRLLFPPLILLFVGLSNASFISAQGGRPGGSNVVGDIRVHTLASRIFNNTRKLRVLLPPNYEHDRERHYPVLYLNDGQNLFDAGLSQFNPMEWKVDETVQKLIEAKEIEPIIVVGIDNAGKRARANEYLPFEDKYLTPPIPDPQGSRYPDFLTKEVVPFVEKRYRVKAGAGFRALGGSSYGALIALYTIIRRPNIFGRILLESPSFYVSDAQILNEAKTMVRVPEKVYLGVGTNEENKGGCKTGDLGHEAVRDVLRLQSILLARKQKRQNIEVTIENCAIHNEESWARRFPNALRFLFGK